MGAEISKTRFFSKEEVESLLNAAMGKTLLEVDSHNLFV